MTIHHIKVTRTARYLVWGDLALAEHVWFALHGYGQLASGFLENLGSLHQAPRAIVVPEALSRFYLDQGRGPVGASWMTREEREEEIADYVDYLDAVFHQISERTGSAARRYLLGFSQGVATAGRWLDRGTSRFAGACFWAGTLPPEMSLESTRPGLARLRVAVVLGEQDTYLTGSWLSRETGRLTGVADEVRAFRFPGGHRLDRVALPQVATYLESP